MYLGTLLEMKVLPRVKVCKTDVHSSMLLLAPVVICGLLALEVWPAAA